MDFFLAYKCYFWIAGNSGVDDIAVTFRKPMIDLNMAPISGLKITSKKTLLCSKIYMNKKNQKLSLNDIFKNGVEKIDAGILEIVGIPINSEIISSIKNTVRCLK